jgi:hypothetical protein|tara:strand:- start:301 stop:1290 length:990 start_codon:yes stop_codon:yes gene_type:complete
MQAYPKLEFRSVRDFGDILNDTFEFLRFNFKSLARSLLFIAGPFVFLGAIGAILVQSTMAPAAESQDFLDIGLSFLLTFIAGLISYICILLVTYDYMLVYITSETGDIELDQVWRKFKQDWFNMAVTSFGANILIIVGFMLLIVPGVYLLVKFSVVWILRLQERVSFFKALSRCGTLMRGFWWKTCGLLFVLFVIQSIFSSVAQMPYYILEFSVTINSGAEANAIQEFPFLTSLLILLSSLAQFTIAIPCIAITLYYFSLVEHKEGIGLMSRVNRMVEGIEVLPSPEEPVQEQEKEQDQPSSEQEQEESPPSSPTSQDQDQSPPPTEPI